MKEIEHDPRENRKFPQHHEWVKKDFPNAKPRDMIKVMLPAIAIAVGLFLSRNGWPF